MWSKSEMSACECAACTFSPPPPSPLPTSGPSEQKREASWRGPVGLRPLRNPEHPPHHHHHHHLQVSCHISHVQTICQVIGYNSRGDAHNNHANATKSQGTAKPGIDSHHFLLYCGAHKSLHYPFPPWSPFCDIRDLKICQA